jgi:hypothetical protein
MEARQNMVEIVFVVEEEDDGGYSASAVGASIVTQADDLPALRESVREAVHCHFEADERPSIIRLHLVRDELIKV